ncbi:MAG TPA: SWIM zinc finger family protein [Methanospirillum sp.]|nr:SWIM zinc finger family protein [Methanospirillum sp.]
MSDPIEDLSDGALFDERMRRRIAGYFRGRGKKALEIIDQSRVKRYRDFFVVVGTTGEYVVEDEFCSCDDFLHRGVCCAHQIAVRIARATGQFELVDLWYYEDLRPDAGGTAL